MNSSCSFLVIFHTAGISPRVSDSLHVDQCTIRERADSPGLVYCSCISNLLLLWKNTATDNCEDDVWSWARYREKQSMSALAFLRIVGKLKTLKRTGWVHRGISLPESVSDHMYRMAMCSFLLTDPAIDRSRVMKLAVVHDLAEALAGDIAPFQNVCSVEKRKLEEEGLEQICATIGNDSIAHEIKDLWLEYEDCTSAEARVVKDLDKMEMIIQADEYEQDQGKDLEEFFDSTRGCFTTPQVQSWDQELRAQRFRRQETAETSSRLASKSNEEQPPSHSMDS